MTADNIKLLEALDLDAKQVSDLAKNAKLCDALRAHAELLTTAKPDRKAANLMINCLTQNPWMDVEAQRHIFGYIIGGKLPTPTHVKEAAKWWKSHLRVQLDAATLRDFEEHSGVGVHFSPEQITAAVREFVDQNMAEIRKNPLHPSLITQLNQKLKFAAPGDIIATYKEMTQGLKGEAAAPAPAAEPEEDLKEVAQRFKLEKLLARDLGDSLNPPEVARAHRERTGGVVITRFPPEPNGYLHIGHAKSLRFNFKVAADHDGYTYLRYDDTNPEAESREYIDMIKESVEWLGYKPRHITYASDNFQRIYDVALELIRRGKAFVCKLPKEENKRLREAREPSPFRDTPPELNLAEFQKMTDGFYAEGEAVLRAKIDFTHANPTLRDPTIYRIKYVPHPHVGDKWCVYPLYDFVHSLCDSFEDITHSLCSLEFENRRELYYWSLNELNLYRPFVWEYSRLNINYNLISKRKLLRLIQEGVVAGWDDPRLLTLVGLRRRGYPPEAINEFCDRMSVTRRGNDTAIDFSVLEGVIREYLYQHAPHAFAVSEPVRVQLVNVAAARQLATKELITPLSLDGEILLDRADVRAEDRPGYYGLAPGKVVRLRYGPFIRAESVEAGPDGAVAFVRARVLEDTEVADPKGVKGVVHWLSAKEAVPATLRLFDRLFTAPEPGLQTGNFLDDVNPDSLVMRENARVPRDLARQAKVGDRYQFERLGFFCVDPLSDPAAGVLVFNRIVSLKDKEKSKALAG